MPPVRWKIWFHVMAVLVQVAEFVTTAQQMQDAISMSSDGWRPIIGTRRHQQVANSNNNFEVLQAEVSNLETTTISFHQQSTTPQRISTLGAFKDRKIGIKTKHVHKAPNSYFVPSGPQQHSMGIHQYKKMQMIKKPVMTQSKRKPMRGQAMAHSSRNEIYLPAPSHNSGAFAFAQSATPNNNKVKTRESQGFGLLSNNFGLSQQGAHIELGRFPLTGDSILQRPTFFLAKPLQNDEFTRNLVPPPQRGNSQQKKKGDTKISLYAFREGPATDASSSISQFGPRPNQFLPPAPPTFDLPSQQQQQPQNLKQQLTNEQAVDVQVTKETLQQFTGNGSPTNFGTIPGRNNFPIGYVDYSFQKPRPQDPNTLTYEVTESKWLDTPSQQYQFRPQGGFFQFQNLKQPSNNARPGFLFQGEVSTQKPPIFESPLVDLSVPPFLPTPYKPENGVIPTSPTQSEAATVFTQVSQKMNRYRNNALKEEPLFFDIKDVSTHYPILGNPEGQSEVSTDTPLPMNEKGEISNELTTQRERTRRPATSQSTSTRDPTKSRITNRRRPRPKKPSTTTTEESVVDTYESIKSQETIEEVPVETERPTRRRRPRPTAHRQHENRRPVEEELPRQRGSYRFKNRERPSTERSDTNIHQRKLVRPSYSENIIREQSRYSVEETTPLSMEQYSFERRPSSEHIYSQETSEQSDEQAQRFETEMPVRQYESSQELPIKQEVKPFIEEIHPVTEKAGVAVTAANTEESGSHFHVPENNEIDFTTQMQELPEDLREEMTTTTQLPTTTTEVATVKSVRIRKPSRFDNSNRPKFSVKEYKNRLNQYTSTTPSTTTQFQGKSTSRFRFPNRHRTRPSPTTASSRVDEDITDEADTTTIRTRFKPKDPRYQAITENDLIITEKSVKAVSTRLRPFGRSRSTTEATTTAPKISIRPNLFSNRRKSGYPSLKDRIQNRLKKNETDDENINNNNENVEQTTSTHEEVEENEPLNVAETATTELSTTTDSIQQSSEETTTEAMDENATEDIVKNEDFMHSQRVSDLTSSFKDYDKPGVFNSVAPTSRSIPNYFTISTDDPILPLEAFFKKTKER